MRTDPRFPRLHIVDHPLIEHKLSLMRNKNTDTQDFRTLLHEIALLMGYEVTRDFPTKLEHIETPICATEAPTLVEKDPVIVPVLRAGLGMTDGLLALIPTAGVGHIGDLRRLEIFARGEGDKPFRILLRHNDRHSLLGFGDRKLRGVKTVVFLRHKVEVYRKTVRKLADCDGNAARTEVVAALYQPCRLRVGEKALELALLGSVALLDLRSADLD